MIDDVFDEIVGEDAPGETSSEAAPAVDKRDQKSSAVALEDAADSESWDQTLVEELSGPASGALSLGDMLHDDTPAGTEDLERELSGAFSGEHRTAIPLSGSALEQESPAERKPRPHEGSSTKTRSSLELSEPVPGVEPLPDVSGPPTGASGKRAAVPPAAHAPAESTARPSPAAPAAPPRPRSAEKPPAHPVEPEAPSRSGGRGKLIGILVSVFALAAVGFGAYMVLSSGDEPATVSEARPETAEATPESAPVTAAGSGISPAGGPVPGSAGEPRDGAGTAAETPSQPAPARPDSTARASDPPGASATKPQSAAAKRPQKSSSSQETAGRAPSADKRAPAEPAPSRRAPTKTARPDSGAASAAPGAATARAAASPEPTAEPAPAEAPAEEATAEAASSEPVAALDPPVSLIDDAPPAEDASPPAGENAGEATSAASQSPAEETEGSAEAVAESEPAAPGPLLAGLNGVTDPELIADTRIPPAYPERAIQLGHRGKCRVILELTIGTDGLVRTIKVLQEQVPHMGFAESATEAVSLWRFVPARLNGKPVEVKKTIVVNFDR